MDKGNLKHSLYADDKKKDKVVDPDDEDVAEASGGCRPPLVTMVTAMSGFFDGGHSGFGNRHRHPADSENDSEYEGHGSSDSSEELSEVEKSLSSDEDDDSDNDNGNDDHESKDDRQSLNASEPSRSLDTLTVNRKDDGSQSGSIDHRDAANNKDLAISSTQDNKNVPTLVLSPVRISSNDLSPAQSSASRQTLKKQIIRNRIKRIFGIALSPDEDVSAFSCFLLKSALVKGHLYISPSYLFFFAKVQPGPEQNDLVLKTGHLKKVSKHLHHHRYYVVLKLNALYFFKSSSDKYFPHSSIDISSAVEIEHKPHDSPSFVVTTAANRRVRLTADNYRSASEWILAIEKARFALNHEGGTLKITVPCQNIVSVEEANALEFANTVRLTVLDDDETYSVEEYYFSLFSTSQRMFQRLHEVAEEAGAKLRDKNKEANSGKIGSSLSPSPTRGRALSKEEDRASSESRRSRSRGLVAGLLAPDSSGESKPGRITGRLRSLSRVISPVGAFRRRRSIEPFPSKPSQEDKSSHNEKQVQAENANSETENKPNQGTDETGNEVMPYDKSQRPAEGWSEWMLNRTKRMHGYLTGIPLGYVGKVTEMWSGTAKHFGEGATIDDGEQGENAEASAERFQKNFLLPESEKLVASYFCYIYRVIPAYGKLYISDNYVCFRSFITRLKMILPIRDVENVEKEKGFRFGYSGLVVVVRGHEEIFFEFKNATDRGSCEMLMLRRFYALSQEAEQKHLEACASTTDTSSILSTSISTDQDKDPYILSESGNLEAALPPIFDCSGSEMLTFKPTESLRFTALTIGSRGDVQPYIALGLGMLKEGHKFKIATHAEFKDWVESYGIEFAPVAGDPAKLMKLSTEYGLFTLKFFKEATKKFRGWVDDLLITSWDACQNTDVLIESPSAMAGIHIAEALKIPFFQAFTMPWTRTRTYPHAFAVPNTKMGGSYNYFSYVMFENVFWRAISGQVNRWRTTVLHLPKTNLAKLQPSKVPFLYNFSPHVVPPPLDFSDWIKITGYWFLDEGKDHKPPQELVDFIATARKDGKKVVYIGFGSIVVSRPRELTKAIIQSVMIADVRCILSKGWSDRLETPVPGESQEVALPKEIIQVKSVPHDWLFPQVDVAVHHGGSGTTGASLRAGVPTLIKPFFGDQFFFATRVRDLGVGIYIQKLNVKAFSKSLTQACSDQRMIERANILGEKIRAEDGVGTAIQTIYRDLDYAKSLTLRRSSQQGVSSDLEGMHIITDTPEEAKRFLSAQAQFLSKHLLSYPWKYNRLPVSQFGKYLDYSGNSERNQESKKAAAAASEKQGKDDEAPEIIKSDNDSDPGGAHKKDGSLSDESWTMVDSSKPE